MITPEHIVDFWFSGCDDNKALEAKQVNKWTNEQGYARAFITRYYAGALNDAQNGKLDHWEDTKEGCLALIILFDTFTRYIYAGTHSAFNNDHRAVEILKHAIKMGFDKKWTLLQRMHGYLPFEHAEDYHLQEEAVRLYAELKKLSPAINKKWFDGALTNAIVHRDVVERFGRFPLRNIMVNRPSTAKELSFLAGLKRLRATA